MIVYDLEIKKAILAAGEAPMPGIEYCSGWKDHKGQGISVLCAYDYTQDRYRVFCDDNLRGFQDLVDGGSLVIGFNSQHFDDQVCNAHGLQVKTGYDLLREIYKALGLDPFPSKYGPEYRGFSLDAMAVANGLGAKSGQGSLAPVDWQQGRVGSVVDYCLQDVRITKGLVDLVLSGTPLFAPDGRKLFLRKPEF